MKKKVLVGLATGLIVFGVVGYTAIAQAGLIGIDYGPGSSPANWNHSNFLGSYSNLITESGMVSNVDVSTDFGNGGGGNFVSSDWGSMLPQHSNNLVNIFGGLSSNTINVNFSDLIPNTVYDLYVFGGWASWGGSADQTVVISGGGLNDSFTQSFSAGTGLWVNDLPGNNSLTLTEDYNTIQHLSSNSGTLSIKLQGLGGSANLQGIAINEASPVPEPATLLLMGTGLAGLIGARRKKK